MGEKRKFAHTYTHTYANLVYDKYIESVISRMRTVISRMVSPHLTEFCGRSDTVILSFLNKGTSPSASRTSFSYFFSYLTGQLPHSFAASFLGSFSNSSTSLDGGMPRSQSSNFSALSAFTPRPLGLTWPWKHQQCPDFLLPALTCLLTRHLTAQQHSASLLECIFSLIILTCPK